MTKTTYLIHGFNVKDRGQRTTDLFRPLLEVAGHRVIEIDYPWMFRLRTRMCNRGLAMVIAGMADENVNVIAHSNGAALTYLAATMGAKFGHVTLVNPALDEKLAIPNAVSVDVWHSPSDFPVLIAKYIPVTIWGAQGRYGYRGKTDERYRNFDEDHRWQLEAGHSGALRKDTHRRDIANNHLAMSL